MPNKRKYATVEQLEKLFNHVGDLQKTVSFLKGQLSVVILMTAALLGLMGLLFYLLFT